MKKLLALITVIATVFTMCISCKKDPDGTGETSSNTVSQTAEKPTAQLNGTDISEYTIVYSSAEPEYNKTAAYYIRDSIEEKTGIRLDVKVDEEGESDHEIIVGETSRGLSMELDAETEPLEFSMLSNETSIAMEADYFVIAAAAYYFVEAYITGESFDSDIPDTVTVNAPKAEAPKNFIFLIGDGMGMVQTKMLEYAKEDLGVGDSSTKFYGYMLPYIGYVKTNSLSGVTDSAASGTALATGYKTINGYIGKDKALNDVRSLTELAYSLGKATAVMSTEPLTGATPAAFSAHADNRNNASEIEESQKLLDSTILMSLSESEVDKINKDAIENVLKELEGAEDGFFIMYEEAYIDKFGHNRDLENAMKTMFRFNQAVGKFMEYAFYNPDTFVLITADHETGDLRADTKGNLKYYSTNHTDKKVCVFAYGVGSEVFDNVVIENVQIPKTIAKMWGEDDFGDMTSPYPAL